MENLPVTSAPPALIQDDGKSCVKFIQRSTSVTLTNAPQLWRGDVANVLSIRAKGKFFVFSSLSKMSTIADCCRSRSLNKFYSVILTRLDRSWGRKDDRHLLPLAKLNVNPERDGRCSLHPRSVDRKTEIRFFWVWSWPDYLKSVCESYSVKTADLKS